MSHVLGFGGAMHPSKAIPFPTIPLALARAYHLRLMLAQRRAARVARIG